MHQGRIRIRQRLIPLVCAGAWLLGSGPPRARQLRPRRLMNPAAKAEDWIAISKLPDWSGYWIPNIRDQTSRKRTTRRRGTRRSPGRWLKRAPTRQAGKPRGLFANCLPEGLPSGMLVNHVGMEWVFAPGRVMMFGDGDGNKLRRIYTDGRAHTADVNPTLYGESIGRWEGQTPWWSIPSASCRRAIVAINQAIGVPNDGDMRVVERIRLAGPDTLHDRTDHHRSEDTDEAVEDHAHLHARSPARHRDQGGHLRAGRHVHGEHGQGRSRELETGRVRSGKWHARCSREIAAWCCTPRGSDHDGPLATGVDDTDSHAAC